jgi:hypothetical protein
MKSSCHHTLEASDLPSTSDDQIIHVHIDNDLLLPPLSHVECVGGAFGVVELA